MKQQWLDDASDAQWDAAWVRYITTPPTCAGDAIDGLTHVLDYIDMSDTYLEWMRDEVAQALTALRSRKPVPTLARDLRELAEHAFALEPKDDYTLLLRTIADGMARPRLVR